MIVLVFLVRQQPQEDQAFEFVAKEFRRARVEKEVRHVVEIANGEGDRSAGEFLP